MITPPYCEVEEEPQRGRKRGRDSSAPEPVIEESQRGRATGRGSSAPEPAKGVEPGLATNHAVYRIVLLYLNERMDVPAVKEARRAYAVRYKTPMAKVTKATLEASYHGLRGWIKWANPGVTSAAPELELPVVSKQECVARVHRVLADRRKWLAANNLPRDLDMTNEQRQAFNQWAQDEFAKEPSEQARNRNRRAIRARFNLEKQRRAGCTQLWELLSYAGRVTEEDVRRLNAVYWRRKCASETAAGQCAQVKKWRARKAKDALRRAMSLQRRLEQEKLHIKHCHWHDRQLLRDAQDGSLLATANHCVMEQGRGRLRGSRPGDYMDIGTNQEFSAVAEVLDGPQNRPCTDRFKH